MFTAPGGYTFEHSVIAVDDTRLGGGGAVLACTMARCKRCKWVGFQQTILQRGADQRIAHAALELNEQHARWEARTHWDGTTPCSVGQDKTEQGLPRPSSIAVRSTFHVNAAKRTVAVGYSAHCRTCHAEVVSDTVHPWPLNTASISKAYAEGRLALDLKLKSDHQHLT